MYFIHSIILLITCCVLYLYWYLKKKYLFFEQHGIAYLKPNFLFGNMADVMLLRKSMAEAYADLYRQLEPHRLAGIYAGTTPMVLIRDPDLLKDILVKDFDCFTDRGWHVDPAIEPLSYFLFFMNGNEWKNLRIKLTSAFTSGKMKMMFPLVNACGEKFLNIIDQTPHQQSFDIKDLSARYTTDVIASCAFGLEVNSLNDANAEFRVMGKKILQFRFRSLLKMLQLNMIPKLIEKLLNITFFDIPSQKFFGDIIETAIVYREKNNIVRNDLLNLLMAVKNDKSCNFHDTKMHKDLRKFIDQVGVDKESNSNIEITNTLLAAQAILFFLAGFETSSTTLSYALLELSQNKPVQDKVRKEILDVLSANNGQISYDILKELPYTDMVMEETLRKYPPISIINRKTNVNYKVRDSNVVIPAGTTLVVSIYGLHLDEKYFPDAQTFCPERFAEEQKFERHNFVYLPFGEGPRHCIGMRFAKMMVKVGLIHALRNYSYQVSPKMKFPLEYDKNFGLLTPYNSVLLQSKKL